MKQYQFADLYISMPCRYDMVTRRAEKYLVSDEQPADITISLTAEQIQAFQEKYSHLTLEEAELIMLSSRFDSNLIHHNGFVLHSSAIRYKEKAVLFSANSGVGKSTHTRLWQSQFGEDQVTIINDDKPAIRQIADSFFAYGTPFSGNSEENQKLTVPLHAIVFLEQSEENAMRQLTAKEALPYYLYNLPQYSKNAIRMDLLLTQLDTMLRVIPSYLLSCNMQPEAAILAEQTLFSPKM